MKIAHGGAAGRNFLHTSLNAGMSLGAISVALGRARSTLSREVRRNAGTRQACDAGLTGQAARARVRRGDVKLREGTALRKPVFGHVQLARPGWPDRPALPAALSPQPQPDRTALGAHAPACHQHQMRPHLRHVRRRDIQISARDGPPDSGEIP